MYRRKLFIVFLLLFVFTYAKSQDKIVTTHGDTIFCKIESISLEFIKYEKRDLNRMPVNYSIQMRQVREYSLGPRTEESDSQPQYNIETPKPISAISENKKDTTLVSASSYNKKETKQVPTPPKRKQAADPFSPSSYSNKKTESFSRWRIAIQGGGSYLINSLAHSRQAMKDLGVYPTTQADDYYNKFRLGLSAGADVYYLISRSFGIGVKGSGYMSKSVQMNYTVGNPYSARAFYPEVSQRERFYLYYAGPSFLLQQWLGDSYKFRLNEELSVGYIFYRDQSQFDPILYTFVNPETNQNLNNVLKQGKTFSGIFQLSLEYYLSSKVSIGLSAAAVPVIFRSLNVSENGAASVVETLGKSHSLDLSRVDASLSLRFHF